MVRDAATTCGGMVFSTAVFEPAIYLPHDGDARAAMGRGW
jgi:hypothetical protein